MKLHLEIEPEFFKCLGNICRKFLIKTFLKAISFHFKGRTW